MIIFKFFLHKIKASQLNLDLVLSLLLNYASPPSILKPPIRLLLNTSILLFSLFI